MIRKTRKWMSLGLVLGGVTVLGGVMTTAPVSAAVPSANDGKIHACRHSAADLLELQGALRIIDNDAGEICKTNETALQWSPDGSTIGAVRTDLSNSNLSNISIRNRDMHGANLKGADLTGIDFRYDNFDGADFSDATISGAVADMTFRNANFSDANLVNLGIVDQRAHIGDPDGYADFRNANFKGAIFNTVYAGVMWPVIDFRGADVTGTSFTRVVSNAIFEGTDFRKSFFTPADPVNGNVISFADSNFNYTNFSGMTINHLHFGDGAMSIAHADFSYATLPQFEIQTIVSDYNGGAYANFRKAQISDGYVTDSFMQHSVFANAYIKDSTFTNDDFTGADFAEAVFDNVDLTGSILTDADIRDASWQSVACPDGTNSNDNGDTCEGHLDPSV